MTGIKQQTDDDESIEYNESHNGAEEWETWADIRISDGLDAAPQLTDEALRHIATENDLCEFKRVDNIHNQALSWIRYDWAPDALGIDPANDEITIHRRQYTQPDTDVSVEEWQDIRYMYRKDTNRGRYVAESLLQDQYDFITTNDTDELLIYDPETGTYTAELSNFGIFAEIKDGLGKHWSTHERNEIISRLKQDGIIERRQFNGRQQFEDPHICVENGVLNLLTGELKDHSPEYYFTDRIPVRYHPDADTAVYEQCFDDWTERDADKKALIEMVGHALVPDANERYKKFLMLTGDADNGKSVFFRCVKALLNGSDGTEQNISNVKLSKVSTQRFSKDSVYGNMANIAGEVDGKKIRNTASLKDITGGDSVEIEPKGKQSFFDEINATMMFAANDPPILGERDKQAIASRLVPVKLPYTFVNNPSETDQFEKQRIPESDLEAKLLTNEALSGLLRLAVDGIQRLETNGDVSLPETPLERLHRYERSADPMRQFGHECLKNQDGEYVVKADITTMYKTWAKSRGHELGSNTHQTLHGALQGMAELNYASSRPDPADYADVDIPLQPWDERKRVVSRVTLTQKGMQCAANAGIIKSEDDTNMSTDADSKQTPDTLASRDPGYGHEFEATVTTVNDGAYTYKSQGRLKGPNDTYISYVVPGGNDTRMSRYENCTVCMESVTLRTNDDGLVEAKIDDETDISTPNVSDTDTDTDPKTETDALTTATDGGKSHTRGT